MQQTARANAKGRAAIRRLTDFLSVQAKMEANKQTFGKFLGLGFPSDTESVSVHSKNEQESLVFRYKLPNDRLKHLQDDTILRKGPSLSTYAAILDELTTQSLIAGAIKHPRPGVSVTLQCQWGAHNALSPEEVDIVTTVTKQGRTLGFVRAEVRDPSTNGMICHFDHVKYLPIGWALGLLLTPFGMWCMNFVLNHVAPLFQKKKTAPLPNYQGILDSFEFTSDKSASFSYGPQHANGVGGLHGGVQAILMEKLGRKVAKTVFGPNVGVECQGLQVSYQSSASKKLALRAHVIDPPQADRLTLRIEILRASKKKRTVVSEGILTFHALSKKDQ